MFNVEWDLRLSFNIQHSTFNIRDFVIHPAAKSEVAMDDIERNDNGGGDDDDQFEQMIIENSILLHSLAALLVRKGVLKQEEIDAEMDKLYDEMEKFDEE